MKKLVSFTHETGLFENSSSCRMDWEEHSEKSLSNSETEPVIVINFKWKKYVGVKIDTWSNVETSEEYGAMFKHSCLNPVSIFLQWI